MHTREGTINSFSGRWSSLVSSQWRIHLLYWECLQYMRQVQILVEGKSPEGNGSLSSNFAVKDREHNPSELAGLQSDFDLVTKLPLSQRSGRQVRDKVSRDGKMRGLSRVKKMKTKRQVVTFTSDRQFCAKAYSLENCIVISNIGTHVTCRSFRIFFFLLLSFRWWLRNI